MDVLQNQQLPHRLLLLAITGLDLPARYPKKGCCGYSDGMIWLQDSLSTSPDKSHFIDTINRSGRPTHVPEKDINGESTDPQDLIPACAVCLPINVASSECSCILHQCQRTKASPRRRKRWQIFKAPTPRANTQRPAEDTVGHDACCVTRHLYLPYLHQSLDCVNWKRNGPCAQGGNPLGCDRFLNALDYIIISLREQVDL